MTRPGAALATVVLAAFALFIAADAVLFYTPLYRSVLDPRSSTGSFEAAIDAFDRFQADPRRDVLVVGDSRVYGGFDPAAAAAAAPGFRFLNGGVPGTSPRSWYVWLKAIDPRADRFRALVIPVDTYADDDSAIGSLDGDDRQMDLRQVALAVKPPDALKIAGSFNDARVRLGIALDLLLRGPELRNDVQELAADPAARLRAIEQERANPQFDPLASHPFPYTMAGLRVDFARGTIAFPPTVEDAERKDIAAQVLHVAKPSPSYARYRAHWLAPIAQRYYAAGVPVFFVRIPTRPVHRSVDEPLGVLRDIALAYGARFISPDPYLALERPELFSDEDHLNRAGMGLFSRRLGKDVAAWYADLAPSGAAGHAMPVEASQNTLFAVLSNPLPLQFQTYEFWLFFALVLAAFYLCPLRARKYVLIAASYVFYIVWNGWYVLCLVALTVADYAIALGLQHARGRGRHALLACGVAANVGFLGTLKYANFVTGTIAAVAGLHVDPWLVSWFVPIGISFHTFQSISYLVDVYRGKTPAVRKIADYALYLGFFPQLLAGPIVRAGLFFGELFHWHPPGLADVSYACGRIAFGLLKKVAIADQFAPVSDAYFASVAAHPGAPAAWGAVFAFSMQIYFDFSGYSDIAIGCARLMGFVFPENFNLPYLATSVTDFWRRWHITLSTWLRDYLYISLGGNRYGLAATLRNLMVTMLLGGLWHGAQWTFVAWGGVHGVLLALERLAGIGRAGDVPKGAVSVVRVAVTFVVVSLAWVLFRAQSFLLALAVYRALFAGGWGESIVGGWPAVLACGIVIFGAVRLAYQRWGRPVTWNALSPLAQAGALAAMLLALEIFAWPGVPAAFIYFKF